LRVAACLGAWLAPLPGLRGGLGGFAREFAGLNFRNCLMIRLLDSFTGCIVLKTLQKCLYLRDIAEFERFLHVGLKSKKRVWHATKRQTRGNAGL
jgi:hypothetical protein